VRCGSAAGPLLGRAGEGRGEGCGALGRESAQVGALLFPLFNRNSFFYFSFLQQNNSSTSKQVKQK